MFIYGLFFGIIICWITMSLWDCQGVRACWCSKFHRKHMIEDNSSLYCKMCKSFREKK